jgi:hypothetical protein
VVCGTAVTLLLVNLFPARRARDLLMLMGLVFAGAIIPLLRYVQPENSARRVAAGCQVFFSTLQSPVTRPAVVLGRRNPCQFAGQVDFCTRSCGRRRWNDDSPADGGGALALCRLQSFAGSKKGALPITGRSNAWRRLPASPVRRALLVKDIKVFLRDVTQEVAALLRWPRTDLPY